MTSIRELFKFVKAVKPYRIVMIDGVNIPSSVIDMMLLPAIAHDGYEVRIQTMALNYDMNGIMVYQSFVYESEEAAVRMLFRELGFDKPLYRLL